MHLGERRNINKEPSFAFIAIICHLVRDNIKSLSVVQTVHITEGKLLPFSLAQTCGRGKRGLLPHNKVLAACSPLLTYITLLWSLTMDPQKGARQKVNGLLVTHRGSTRAAFSFKSRDTFVLKDKTTSEQPELPPQRRILRHLLCPGQDDRALGTDHS